jgi:spheroidene monooxygenase
MTHATLSLFRFAGIASRLWVLGQMGAARLALRADPAAPRFWKLCGSGTGEGFTPRPNWDVWAILAVWPDEGVARARLAESPVWTRWRARAVEEACFHLSPVSARGVWAGVNPFAPEGGAGGQDQAAPGAPGLPPAPEHSPAPEISPAPGLSHAPGAARAAGCPFSRAGEGRGPAVAAAGAGVPARPLAALTRATVRPGHALRFWGRVPDISAVIGQDPNVAFKIGIGEVPLLHQVTFSVWPDAAAMAGFARGDGPHGRAIRAVREGGWFAEELYARFEVTAAEGQWEGRAPLARLTAQVAA